HTSYSRDWSSDVCSSDLSSLCRAIATCLLAGAMLPAMAQDAAPEEDPGQVGDVASWRTDEFMADWGLGAIGAEYAYARGLTGHRSEERRGGEEGRMRRGA